MSDLAPVSVVIIGVNVATHLESCIQGLLKADYPQDKLEILYVDGGSSDQSVKIAESHPEVKTIALDLIHPTPGLGRNRGAQETSHEIIQFLDGDTIVDPAWFRAGVAALQAEPKLAAVCGQLREKDPQRNFYHRTADIEWGQGAGEISAFGGNVILKKSALLQAGGYDRDLIAGEDPELSYRLRQEGYQLLRLREMMGLHDICMDQFGTYLRRSFRTGHAYAELALRYSRAPEKLWMKELLRIVLGCTAPWLVLLLGLSTGWVGLALLISITLLLRPLRHLPRYQNNYGLSASEALLYSLHLSFVIYPQFAGALRYLATFAGRAPLKNRGRRARAS